MSVDVGSAPLPTGGSLQAALLYDGADQFRQVRTRLKPAFTDIGAASTANLVPNLEADTTRPATLNHARSNRRRHSAVIES